VLLTTQYLEEADLLADRIVVIDSGSVIAQGTSDDLKAQVGGDRIQVTLAPGSDLGVARATLARLTEGQVHLDPERRSVDASVPAGASAIPAIAAAVSAAGLVIDDLGMVHPSLDDVFLTLTGHPVEPVKDPGQRADLA
jgi:ABC-2 type transport system ATP-binding protein